MRSHPSTVVMLAILAAAGVPYGQPAPPPDLKVAQETPLTVDVAVPDDAGGVLTPLCCGPEGLTVALQTREGTKKTLTLKLFAASLPVAGGEATSLPEAGVEVVELRIKRYLRPNPLMLKPALRAECVKGWDSLPSPRQLTFTLGFRQSPEGVLCLLDGNYVGRIFETGRLATMQIAAQPGSAVGETAFLRTSGDLFHPVDCAASLGGSVALEDSALLQRVPLGATSAAGLDLGMTAGQQARYADYTYRCGLDGLPESFITSVPSAQYTRAWVLCSVDADPAKDPVLTARLTRYFSNGPYTGRARDCLADTSVTLPRPGEQPGDGITKVGTVTSGDGLTPLYLVEVPLQSGDIQDLIFTERAQQRGNLRIGPYLDFELLGRLKPQDRPHPFNDDRMFPDARFASGVRVHGVTLERTPVEMEIRQPQPGLIFCGDETPELQVALRPVVDGACQLRWSMKDADGKPCGSGTKDLSLKVADGEQIIPVSLRQPQVGWYEIQLELLQGPRRLLGHNASYALLPPDTRQAGYESPYATWWFDHHYGCSDPQVIGPLILKAGFRKAAYAVSRHTEEALAPWKFTAAAVSWGAMRDVKVTDEQIETAIRDTLTRYPHCDNILLFHESMPNAPLGTRTAPELLGLPVKEYPGSDERWAHVTRVAKIVRDKFPGLKIFIGNSGASSELIAEGLRRKFPREYVDYIGVEAVGRTGHPEKLWEGGTPGVWLLREIARKYDYPWGVTSCYEANYRHDRLLGQQRQAEWYVRDLLLMHAYRFPYMSIGLLHDVGNSYHASFWGATGLCRRYPLLYPKKSYVAMATATRVLDRVTLKREMPTGSNCVYALEFERADGKRVYPLWTARGTCAMSLTLRGGAAVEIVDLYGRSRTVAPVAGKLALTANGAVQYLITSGNVSAIACGKRSYPDDQPPAAFKVAVALDDAAACELAAEPEPLLEQTTAAHLPFRTQGQFALRGVKDPEKGSCLEIELLPRKEPATPLLSEYGVIRLKEPVTLPGEPATLGVWVKGNSGWGQAHFVIEDAAGVRRISCGTVVHDADVFDYDGRVSIDFDGWCFLSFPMTDASPIPDLSTGSVGNLWEASNRSKPVTYPVKLVGVALSLPQQALHLTEMRPVKQVVRIKEAGAF